MLLLSRVQPSLVLVNALQERTETDRRAGHASVRRS